MAEIRPLAASQLRPAQPPTLAETVRAAQRAFFEAAMSGTQATPEAAPAAAPAKAPPAPQTEAAASAERYLRPGSRLDIRV